MKKTFTLKHIIISFVVGAVVMTSGTVLADKVSQIGNKVAGETAVYVNGTRVSDAVIIKDKSYVPARDVADALGANVEWKGSAGIMINNEVNWEELKRVSDLKAEIELSHANIELLEKSIVNSTKKMEEASGQYKQYQEERIEQSTKELAEEKAKLAQYENELAELEASK